MNELDMTEAQETQARRPLSVILILVGGAFVLVGLAWGRAFVGHIAAGTLTGFEEWRAGAYTITYLAAGVGMMLHTRWAPWAAAAWAVVTVSQFIYPPTPRDEVPLYAQIAVALIVLFWTLGLVSYVRRRTRPLENDPG